MPPEEDRTRPPKWPMARQDPDSSEDKTLAPQPAPRTRKRKPKGVRVQFEKLATQQGLEFKSAGEARPDGTIMGPANLTMMCTLVQVGATLPYNGGQKTAKYQVYAPDDTRLLPRRLHSYLWGSESTYSPT